MKLKILAVLGAAVALAGCNYSSPFPVAKIRALIEPGIGFEIDASGKVTVAGSSIQFQADAGSTGGTIVSYSTRYLNTFNNEIIPGDSTVVGNLSAQVAPGILCDAYKEGSVSGAGCSTLSPGAFFAPGPKSVQQVFQVLQVSIVDVMLAARGAGIPITGWRAEITFNGTVNGANFSWTQIEPIIFPLK
jgi:hypothetical protein